MTHQHLAVDERAVRGGRAGQVRVADRRVAGHAPGARAPVVLDEDLPDLLRHAEALARRLVRGRLVVVVLVIAQTPPLLKTAPRLGGTSCVRVREGHQDTDCAAKARPLLPAHARTTRASRSRLAAPAQPACRPRPPPRARRRPKSQRDSRSQLSSRHLFETEREREKKKKKKKREK